MEIKQSFENIWKVKTIGVKYKEKDKERYYQLFLDGYACALINLEEFGEDSKGEIKMRKKPIKMNLPKCGKCKKILEPRFTTELEDDIGIPKVLMMYGFCKDCKTITMCDIIKTKDIPSNFNLKKMSSKSPKAKGGKYVRNK